jgi:hypothetical protein
MRRIQKLAQSSNALRRLPLFQGLLPFNKSSLPGDIMGGVILAAPRHSGGDGYSKIIGTPVGPGLYTMMLPMIAFAIFGCSRHLVVSADSTTAAMGCDGSYFSLFHSLHLSIRRNDTHSLRLLRERC